MEFKEFSKLITSRFNELAKGKLFKTDRTKSEMWETYLDSFPAGTNEIYKERREYDCQCCSQFVKNIGNVVSIVDNRIVTIWDIEVGGTFQVVCDFMADYVRTSTIKNVFLHTEPKFGQSVTTQELEDGSAINWNHFNCVVPSKFIDHSNATSKLGKLDTNSKVFRRGLESITDDSIDVVLDLIKDGSLYKGEEFRSKVEAFSKLKRAFEKSLVAGDDDIFIWANIGNSAGLIRNSVIGTLLVDLSEGKDINQAVGSYEAKTAPTNYKRTTALVTSAMIEKAMGKIQELGIRESLDRRFAVASDISINNVLFADRDTRDVMQDTLTSDLLKSAKKSSKSFDSVGEVSIEEFIKDILPNISSMKLEVKNRHKKNLVSLVGPTASDAAKLFQWDNRFSWSYTGDITDSIKERVKSAGGDVEGDVRVSLGWFNSDDLDINMITPNKNKVYYGSKSDPATGGKLDVDMNAGGTTNKIDPVENITFKKLSKMDNGVYQINIHQFSKRNIDNGGFDLEVSIDGTSSFFSYVPALERNETVNVLSLCKKGNKVTITNIHSALEAESRSNETWGINTENFEKVSIMCLSPNFWDDQNIGNKHYMFMLEGCKNPDPTRGIYNEFLRSDLHEHRKVLELVGSKTKCPITEDQLSGLGFSSTQRESIIVKVEGNFNRTLKINF